MKKFYLYFLQCFCSGSFAQVFTYKTDTISINLSTKQLAKDKIKFSLTYENNAYKDIVKISGVARNKNIDLNPETDDEEYGEKLAYFADEYIYEDNDATQHYEQMPMKTKELQ